MELPWRLLLFLLLLGCAQDAADDPQTLRTYSAAAHQLLWINWTTKSLDDIRQRQEFLDADLAPNRINPDDSWYDLRPFFENRLKIGFGEAGFAVWNRESRELVIQAPKSQLAPFHQQLAKWNEASDAPRLVALEAICLKTGKPPDPNVFLRESATLPDFLAGKFGEPELLNVAKLRVHSGTRGKAEQSDAGPIETLTLETDAIIAADDNLVDLRFTYEIALKSGESFTQNSAATLSNDRPLLLELGGAGTAESPMHYLLLRAWPEPVK